TIEESSSSEMEITLLKVIDFEDIVKGNMSATAHNSYYDGLIVADGKVTQTSSAKIDDNTLGMRLAANTIDESRMLTINTIGYSKIILDIKQEKTYSKVNVNDEITLSALKNGEIIRDVEIITHDNPEIFLSFYSETSVDYKMDVGIDNIRFYGYGESNIDESSSSNEEISSDSSSVIENSSETISKDDTPCIINGVITMKGIAIYLEDKEEHYPYSDEFIEQYQQSSGGYIDYAKKLGILVDKSKHSPNQKWHFFDSWLYPSIESGSLSWNESAKSRVYSKLLCPELLLWIYEACGVDETKVKQAMDVAIQGKIDGTSTTTIAKNMRSVVSWEDLEVNILNYINSLS
ncbi:MAG: hypothetical protein MR270_02315, partial [Erysipelotrichaceae bacterium]|nr:hypothetical protein [Erysipelotrichaceae bacterium]